MTMPQLALADDCSSRASTDFTDLTDFTPAETDPLLSADTGGNPETETNTGTKTMGPSTDDTKKAPTPAAPFDEDHVYRIIEEATTSARIHAACRLQEAILAVTSAINTIVTRWTGLSPQEAAMAASMYEVHAVDYSLPADTIRKSMSADSLLRARCMMLQKVLRAIHLLGSSTATTVGMALNVRRQGMMHGLMIPLVEQADTDISVILSFLETKADDASLAASLKEAGSPLGQIRNLVMHYATSHLVPSSWRCHNDKLAVALCLYLPRRLLDAKDAVAVAEGAIRVDAARNIIDSPVCDHIWASKQANRKVYDAMMWNLVSAPIEWHAALIVNMVDMAIDIVWWQTTRRNVVQWLAFMASGRTKCRRPEDDDEDLLLEALEVCKQAVAASQAAKHPQPRKERVV